MFAGYRPKADSLLVARMAAAGVVAVGKTNSPEFGAGSHTFNRVYGVTRNPWGLDRSAGGSSGGAAVALACRMVATADGSDTGGSLRNPAAWNNVVGFRPTVRRVPKVSAGNAWMPISTEGPMGRTVDDVALLLGVLGAPDHRDPMHQPLAVPLPVSPPDGPLRVAWSADIGVPVEDSQLGVLAGARQAMVDLGWDVVDDEPELALASDCFRTLRCWNIANGPTAPLHDRIDQIKATIQDEIRRGEALQQHDVAPRLRPARRAVARDGGVLRSRVRPPRLPRHPAGAVPRRRRVPDRGRRAPDVELHRLDGVVLADHGDRLPDAVAPRRLRCRRAAGRDPARRPARVPTPGCSGRPRRWRRRPGSPPAAHRSPAACVAGERHDRCAVISDRVAAHGDRVAVVDPDGTWTFAAIDSDATALAGALPVEHGDRVGIICTPGHDFVVALLACWHAGAIAVPLHPPHPDAELSYALTDSGAAAVVASAGHVDVSRRVAR